MAVLSNWESSKEQAAHNKLPSQVHMYYKIDSVPSENLKQQQQYYKIDGDPS